MSPYPGAYFLLGGLETKIIKCRPTKCAHPHNAGQVSISKKHLHVYSKDGYIDVLELKMEGKRQMNISDFLNGYIN
jgi:methionyl-tRNA formyltransferase